MEIIDKKMAQHVVLVSSEEQKDNFLLRASTAGAAVYLNNAKASIYSFTEEPVCFDF